MMEAKLSSAIWVELSKMIRYPAKKLHDYYHNTFSKRFCSDLNKVKREAIRFFDECPPMSQKRDIVAHILQRLQELYPNTRYHYQTVYQFVNYRVNHNRQIYQLSADTQNDTIL